MSDSVNVSTVETSRGADHPRSVPVPDSSKTTGQAQEDPFIQRESFGSHETPRTRHRRVDPPRPVPLRAQRGYRCFAGAQAVVVTQRRGLHMLDRIRHPRHLCRHQDTRFLPMDRSRGFLGLLR